METWSPVLKKPFKCRVSSSLTSSVNSVSSSISTSTTDSSSKRIRQYPIGHRGPYIVHIRSDNQKKINHSYVSNYLFQSRNGIKVCEKVTPYLCEVECKNIAVANEIPKDKNLSKYSVYIPGNQVEVEGVIYYPSLNDTSDLLNGDTYGFHVTSGNKINIVDVLRLNCKRSDKKTLVPTPLVKVTFKGKQLPNCIIMDDFQIDFTSQTLRTWSFCATCRTVEIPVKPYSRISKQANSSSNSKLAGVSPGNGSCFTCVSEIEITKAKTKSLKQNTQKQHKTLKTTSPEQNGFQVLSETECP